MRVRDGERELQLENGYVKLIFDKRSDSITGLFGDFAGSSDFSTNVLARPFTLTTVLANSTRTDHCSDRLDRNSSSRVLVKTDSDDYGEVLIEGIKDSLCTVVAEESWHISLGKSERFVQIRIDGGTVSTNTDVISIGHTLYSGATSLYGLFERGSLQMMNNAGKCLGSDQPVDRLYALGNGQAVDVLYRQFPSAGSSQTETIAPRELVLRSQYDYEDIGGQPYGSAIQDVLVGFYPRKSLSINDAWSSRCWEDATPVSTSFDKWSYSMSLGPNNMNFPVYPIADANSTLSPRMPDVDIRTFLTGVYASPVGCLQSYYELRDGTIAPTISHPDVGYSPNTNFFDPDNFISISAMLYSGDSYLMNEVRKVIERTAETMCGIGKEADASYCDAGSSRRHPREASRIAVTHPLSDVKREDKMKPRTGQLMHHFINLEPTYESIATSEQLGPNIFWSLSAIRYASLSNDAAWLERMLPYFELCARFLASFYDEDQGMLLVPGPLWIDVLVRENYTSDSNAIAPYVFREIAEVFEHFDTLPHFSDELRRMAEKITTSMNKALWDSLSDDHYITQLDSDLTTTRDFVDYDSNLLAVAFHVAPDDRVGKLLQRVDSGAHTHVRGTWCCEVPYSGDAEDCYIVGGDVCGDSIVTLGRIGWADSHARKRVGDVDTFEKLLLHPLQEDLIEDTWLFERYDENGTQIRTSYYFEYPSLVAMMLTEIRYGIEISLTNVKVNPFPTSSFVFSFGSLAVEFSSTRIYFEQKADSPVSKMFYFHGLPANTQYLSTGPCSAKNTSYSTSTGGVLTFKHPIQSGCPIILEKINISSP